MKMPDYRIIRLYTREKARFEGKPLSRAVVDYIHSLGTTARCVVMRGVEGLYETGEMMSASIVEGSYDLPLVIDIVLPNAEFEAVIAKLETMVTDGFVTVSGASVTSYRTPEGPLPPHLLVRDIMTPEPIAAHRDFSVRVAVELLLDRGLKSLPVVDDRGAPIGILTQGDLSRKAAMPVRLGLLDTLGEGERVAWLRSLETVGIAEVMTIAPKMVRDDQKASSAVHFMARARMKRLPVVDSKGSLVGMLSRIDVLRALARGHEHDTEAMAAAVPTTATASAPTGPTAAGASTTATAAPPAIPTPTAGPASKSGGGTLVEAAPSRLVRDLEERDTLALDPGTTIQAAIDALARDSSQRAAVVDPEGRLLGLVTDRLLVEAIDRDGSRRQGLGRILPHVNPTRTIFDIMLKKVESIGEGATLEAALRLMTERGLKRIPVVDDAGKFKGMLRRDTVLLAMTERT